MRAETTTTRRLCLVLMIVGLTAVLSSTGLLAASQTGVTNTELVTVPSAFAQEARNVESTACAPDPRPFGLPRAAVETAVLPGCPADGNICFDGDLCRAQCRLCGIELGACVWGLCRCFDT